MNSLARDTLTELLITKYGMVQKSESPAEIAFGRVYKTPGAPTLKACKIACQKIGEHFGIEACTHMLQRYGVERVKDLWAGQWLDFVSFAEAMLQYDVPPTASWDVKDGVFKPMKGAK